MGSILSRSSNDSTEAREKDVSAGPGLPFDEPKHQSHGAAESLPLRADIEHEVLQLPKNKQAKARQKIRDFKDAIQPHTDEGGDAHYIGDAYEPVRHAIAREWEDGVIPGPYLKYVRELSEEMPHLEYLALWMTVGCAPPKWRFLIDQAESRAERVSRANVCVLDFSRGRSAKSQQCDSVASVHAALSTSSGEVRLIVVEDLSRDLVEELGSCYDVDPLFFLSHLGDYLFHNTRDRWVELPNLDIDARDRSHFNLQYLRPRYYKDEQQFTSAERESGMFNVLRRLDSDRSRKGFRNSLLDRSEASVTLTRAKTSLWVKPRSSSEDPVTAILLVDPTVKSGRPLWGGYRPFTGAPSMKDWAERKTDTKFAAKSGCSLYDSVGHWTYLMTDDDLEQVKQDPRYVGLSVYKLVLAEWLAVLKYMTTMFGGIEWSFEKPHWGEPEDISELLQKLSPWRRNVAYYQAMINDSITRLFPDIAAAYPGGTTAEAGNFANPTGIQRLWADFKNVKQQMDEHKARIVNIQTMATNAINTEEARRAVKQNRNLARLTFLATIFIPLNFTSSFLSMSPAFGSAPGSTTTIWIFFVVGVPLTLTALIVVDLMHPQKRGVIRKQWHKIFPKKDEEDKEEERRPQSNGSTAGLRPGRTGIWPYHRANTSFAMK